MKKQRSARMAAMAKSVNRLQVAFFALLLAAAIAISFVAGVLAFLAR